MMRKTTDLLYDRLPGQYIFPRPEGKYVLLHYGDVAGTGDDYIDMLRIIRRDTGLTINVNKMLDDLAATGRFRFALGIFEIVKTNCLINA